MLRGLGEICWLLVQVTPKHAVTDGLFLASLSREAKSDLLPCPQKYVCQRRGKAVWQKPLCEAVLLLFCRIWPPALASTGAFHMRRSVQSKGTECRVFAPVQVSSVPIGNGEGCKPWHSWRDLRPPALEVGWLGWPVPCNTASPSFSVQREERGLVIF